MDEQLDIGGLRAQRDQLLREMDDGPGFPRREELGREIADLTRRIHETWEREERPSA